MIPLVLPNLVSSLSRQLAQMARYAAFRSPPALGAYRCLSTISTAAAPARATISSMAALRSPLLGQCQQLTCVQPMAGMKTKTSLRRRCKDCFFVRRRGRLFVFCKTHPRHKQRQG